STPRQEDHLVIRAMLALFVQLLRTGVCTTVRFLFAKIGVKTRYRDVTSTEALTQWPSASPFIDLTHFSYLRFQPNGSARSSCIAALSRSWVDDLSTKKDESLMLEIQDHGIELLEDIFANHPVYSLFHAV